MRNGDLLVPYGATFDISLENFFFRPRFPISPQTGIPLNRTEEPPEA